MPEGGECAIANAHRRQLLKALQLLRHKFTKVGFMVSAPIIPRMGEKPTFPRQVALAVHSMNKFQKQAVIHVLKVFDAEAALLLDLADIIPSNQAIGAMTFFFTRPKKSPALRIQGLPDSFREEDRGHKVNGQATKDRVNQDNTPAGA